MIGGADDDGVDVLLLGQHPPEITMPCYLRHVFGDELPE
jgi:hypothetical protein